MGKKYNAGVKIAPAVESEIVFFFSAYEGIKPSRAVAIEQGNKALAMVEQDDRWDRPTNHKPSTDKRGRRPVVAEVTEKAPRWVLFNENMGSWEKRMIPINVSQHWENLGKVVFSWGTSYMIEEGDQGQYLLHVTYGHCRGGFTFGFKSYKSLRYELNQIDHVDVLEALGLE